MNRKQRRAAHVQSPPAGAAGDAVRQLLGQATQFERQGRLDDAARTYKKLLALKPDHAEALNNLGCVLQAQGKLAEASARFARALALTPQLYDQFAGVIATLAAVLPALAEAMQRANAAWPRRLAADELFAAEGHAAAERDPLLLDLLRATPVRDLALERVLTSLRAALLADAVADKPVGAAGSPSPPRWRSSASSTNMCSPPRPRKMRNARNCRRRPRRRCKSPCWRCTRRSPRWRMRRRCSRATFRRRSPR